MPETPGRGQKYFSIFYFLVLLGKLTPGPKKHAFSFILPSLNLKYSVFRNTLPSLVHPTKASFGNRQVELVLPAVPISGDRYSLKFNQNTIRHANILITPAISTAIACGRLIIKKDIRNNKPATTSKASAYHKFFLFCMLLEPCGNRAAASTIHCKALLINFPGESKRSFPVYDVVPAPCKLP
jgi:hypothetical protein